MVDWLAKEWGHYCQVCGKCRIKMVRHLSICHPEYPSPMSTFLEDALNPQTLQFCPRVIAFDPGETTGFCVFDRGRMIDCGQLSTKTVVGGAMEARRIFNQWAPFSEHTKMPVHCVMEDFRVYSWKSDDMKWNGMHTSKLIGAIELICHDQQIPLYFQMAQQAKGFCTDDKLRAWGLYRDGLRHGRDAVRHAVYYLLFTIRQIHKRQGV